MLDLIRLFISSLAISLVSFGGGAQALFYQLAVSQNHWLSATDLSAILAFGYATPGPAVFGTATFIGYRLTGVIGAVAGSVGIFIAPWLLAVLATKHLDKIWENAHIRYFVKGVGVAAAGVVAATGITILQVGGVLDWRILIVVVTMLATIVWRVNPLLLLLFGAAVGAIARLF